METEHYNRASLEGIQKLMKLVDALEDDDDVQRVTTNFEINDEVMSQISQ